MLRIGEIKNEGMAPFYNQSQLQSHVLTYTHVNILNPNTLHGPHPLICANDQVLFYFLNNNLSFTYYSFSQSDYAEVFNIMFIYYFKNSHTDEPLLNGTFLSKHLCCLDNPNQLIFGSNEVWIR